MTTKTSTFPKRLLPIPPVTKLEKAEFAKQLGLTYTELEIKELQTLKHRFRLIQYDLREKIAGLPGVNKRVAAIVNIIDNRLLRKQRKKGKAKPKGA